MIGYYVHHHGVGHLNRMRAVLEHLESPVTGLSSLPGPPDVEWVQLDRDDQGSDPVDPQAGGTMHWVPRYDAGLRRRAAEVVSWIDRVEPDLVVVDVSVEIAALARLTGTPVVVMAMPGHRGDGPHVLAYDAADALVAAWPAADGGSDWPRRWLDKAQFVGAFSRFDALTGTARPACETRQTEAGRRRVLLLWGAGGRGPSGDDLSDARAATPGWEWEVADGDLTAAEVWDRLRRVDVVVTHGGQNAVAEVAAARTPAVVVAADRPFDEQLATVRALAAQRIAVGLDGWPPSEQWPRLLDEAFRAGGESWARWSDGHGARRTAAILDELAGRLRQESTRHSATLVNAVNTAT